MPNEFMDLAGFEQLLLAALADRKKSFPDLGPTDLIRLCHEEAPPLRWDKLGEVHWLGWWSDTPPAEGHLSLIQEMLKSERAQSWALEWRRNREKNKNSEILIQQNLPETWKASERDQWYLLKSHQGQSRGVFLDQREQRTWVKLRSEGKSVLNLFAYTCGFSVSAALGGAERVHSVDVSKSYLAWGKENFRLNQINQENHGFYPWDSGEYMNWAHKKGLQYDLIICDPPSFGRSEKGVFQIAKDLPGLLEAAARLLRSRGEILLTTNYEGWTAPQFQSLLREWVQPLGLLIDSHPVRAGQDFKSQNPILKGAVLRGSP